MENFGKIGKDNDRIDSSIISKINKARKTVLIDLSNKNEIKLFVK